LQLKAADEYAWPFQGTLYKKQDNVMISRFNVFTIKQPLFDGIKGFLSNEITYL